MNGIPSFKHLQGLEFHSVSGLFRIKSRDIKWIEFDRTWAFVTLNFGFSYSHIHPRNKRTTTRLFCCLKCFVFLFFCQSRTFLALPLYYFRLISKQHKVKEKEGGRIEKTLEEIYQKSALIYLNGKRKPKIWKDKLHSMFNSLLSKVVFLKGVVF